MSPIDWDIVLRKDRKWYRRGRQVECDATDGFSSEHRLMLCKVFVAKLWVLEPSGICM